MKTHYELLSVEKSATAEEIKKAFRTLSLKMHPDKLPKTLTAVELENAKKNYNDVMAAYEVLNDPAKRVEYDASLNAPQPVNETSYAKSEDSLPKDTKTPSPPDDTPSSDRKFESDSDDNIFNRRGYQSRSWQSDQPREPVKPIGYQRIKDPAPSNHPDDLYIAYRYYSMFIVPINPDKVDKEYVTSWINNMYYEDNKKYMFAYRSLRDIDELFLHATPDTLENFRILKVRHSGIETDFGDEKRIILNGKLEFSDVIWARYAEGKANSVFINNEFKPKKSLKELLDESTANLQKLKSQSGGIKDQKQPLPPADFKKALQEHESIANQFKLQEILTNEQKKLTAWSERIRDAIKEYSVEVLKSANVKYNALFNKELPLDINNPNAHYNYLPGRFGVDKDNAELCKDIVKFTILSDLYVRLSMGNLDTPFVLDRLLEFKKVLSSPVNTHYISNTIHEHVQDIKATMSDYIKQRSLTPWKTPSEACIAKINAVINEFDHYLKLNKVDELVKQRMQQPAQQAGLKL